MWEAMAVSVRGPEHVRERKPNQDACLVRRNLKTVLAVVCDGLGSRPHSGTGARAACRATADAVRHWAGSPGAPTELLLRAVHSLWNMRVHANGRDASATTCLFATVGADGRLVIAQLGDGLVLLKKPGGCIALEPGADRFGNETTGLGISKDVRDWRIHVEPQAVAPMAVLLATDGVADDILPEKREAFLDCLLSDFATVREGTRSRALAAELRSWPTPRHRDDKTVAVLWNEQPRRVAL